MCIFACTPATPPISTPFFLCRTSPTAPKFPSWRSGPRRNGRNIGLRPQKALSIFGGMRSTVLLTGLLLSMGSITDGGQDNPVAIAEREEAQDRHQRVTARIEDLETTLQKHQQKIIEMEVLVRSLRY